MRKSLKTKLILLVFACLAITVCFAMIACADKFSDASGGETRFVVSMHDAVLEARGVGNGKDIQGIQALNLTVIQMVVIGSGGQTVILDEEREMDILGVSRSEPVILSDVSIEPGTYQELRLVLKDENTVTIDGETHPIKIPSGEQSGLKLKGPFVIPKGKLFTLMIELDAARSVSFNQGQGYRLHPVLRISNGPEVLGIFRGNLTVFDRIGAGETLVELREDGTVKMRTTSYPKYTMWGNYNYNSVTKILHLNNFDLEAPGLSQRRINRIMNRLSNAVFLPVKQWSLDNIIAIDTAGVFANLYRVDSFDFSADASFTEFILNVDYPDSSSSGKDVAAVIEFIDTGMTTQTITGTFSGSRFTENVLIPSDYLLSANTRILITAYLFDDPEDLDIEIGVYASNLTELMTNSIYSESTENPWQVPNIFTLQKNSNTIQEFSITFPQRMDITINHDNFTNNNPTVSWVSYPGASGYLVVVLLENKNFNHNLGNISGNRPYEIVYHQHTYETSVTIDSDKIIFIQEDSKLPTINNGDIVIVEVYAMDGSGTLDTANKQGALFMDAFRIVRR